MSIIDSIINVFNKNKGVVITMTDQDIVSSLAPLAPLGKKHYYEPLFNYDPATGLDQSLYIDPARQPLHQQLVRMTGSGSISVNWGTQAQINSVVQACKLCNAGIGLFSSPWEQMTTANKPATDVGVEYQNDLKNLDTQLKNIKTWLTAANTKYGATVECKYLAFDVELWDICKDDKTAIAKKWADLYATVYKYFPNIKIVCYDRLGMNFEANDVGWSDITTHSFFSFLSTEPNGNHAMCEMYYPSEPYFNVALYNKTCDNAASHGVKDVYPWLSLGIGYRRVAGGWDWAKNNMPISYDLINDWFLGMSININWCNQRAARFGKFSQAPAIFLYPQPISCFPEYAPHFISYCKGANNIPL